MASPKPSNDRIDERPSQRANVSKRYWINPPFQLRIIFTMLIVGIVVIGSTSAMLNYYFSDFIKMGISAGLKSNNPFFEFIIRQQQLMNQWFAMLSAFLFVGISIVGMLLSHRVAGPIHRLTLHMIKITQGEEPKPVRFRDNDFFPELALAYNKQLEFLNHVSPVTETSAEHHDSELRNKSQLP